MALTAEQRRVKEGCTALYTATIKDESGVALAASSLSSLTLTLYDLATGTIINSRDRQNVLNANNVTVNASGVLSWTIQPSDNAIVNTITAGRWERHVALFEWTWASGTKAGKHEVFLDIENMAKVP